MENIPKYMQKCLQKVKKNRGVSKELVNGLTKYSVAKGATKSPNISLYKLKTISVRNYCNFINHSRQSVIREIIRILSK